MLKFRRGLAVSVIAVLFVAGCSVAWVTTLDNILVAAAPALIDILNIVSIAEGKPIDAALATKIDADAASIKSIATDFATASTAAAPTICGQLQAAIGTYSQDEQQVVALAQVQDIAIQEKIAVLSGLVAGTVTAITAVIPNCSQTQSALLRMARTAPPLPLRSFVDSYNAELAKKTGNANVDAWTGKHKIHKPWVRVWHVPVRP